MKVITAVRQLGFFLAVVSTPAVAFAGMPAVRFHDVIRLRLEVVSFFLITLLVSAAVVSGVWNYLRRDFPRLPRLTYTRAVGVVVLWGLLFVVVLTMISGARELMTPGAWVRDGGTYKLSDQSDDDRSPSLRDIDLRRRHLVDLGQSLIKFADAHEGRFPGDEKLGDLPRDMLTLPSNPGLQYIYVPDLQRKGPPTLLAYEPAVDDEDVFALFTNGEVLSIRFEELHRWQTQKVQ